MQRIIFGFLGGVVALIGGYSVWDHFGTEFQVYRIRAAIDRANYCDTQNECVLLESKCPFDCSVAVHQNEVIHIRDMLDQYYPQCVYACIIPRGVTCENHKCRAQYQ